MQTYHEFHFYVVGSLNIVRQFEFEIIQVLYMLLDPLIAGMLYRGLTLLTYQFKDLKYNDAC